jgi:hypothetical protein
MPKLSYEDMIARRIDLPAKKPATSKAELQTIEAVRAYSVDILRGFNTTPRTRYEAGFQASFEEFCNLLHPAGYRRDRSRNKLIAGLRKPPTKTSTAELQSIEAVRQYLDDHFALTKKDPPDNRFLYGYEDANWLLWSLVDPMGYAAAVDYLPQ